MAELFELHDRSKFELIAFSFGPDLKDEMRSRVSQAFNQFIDITTVSDKSVAQLSRELGIDIAIDLKGLTLDARLGIFSFKVAPIQVSYLGYPGTLGADYIDYLIADAITIPPELQKHYAEKILYLPQCYLPRDTSVVPSPITPKRSDFGLPEVGFVFCSFNHDYKINPPMFKIWMDLLKEVTGSVLWLMKLKSRILPFLE